MYKGRGGGVAGEIQTETADHSVRNFGACLFLLSLQLVLLSSQNQVRDCLSLHCILYKWKNHFSEMKGDVGMSLHEKEGEQEDA